MKKFASLLLTAVLLCTMLTVFAVPASAEDESQTDDPGITWELSEDGKTLTFTGEGAMPNYDITTFEDRPWHSAAETVTTVQVKPGITALGDYAFFYFEKMTSVTIPDGVTSIGNDAFYHCESLTSVTIPSGVTSIGNSAFGYCESLESVTIPSGVTNIGKSAFGCCESLESVTIPSSVTGIGSNAFASCTSLTNITIPHGVKSIGSGAFVNCSSLESISFPSSITSIGDSAFNFCSNLTSVTVKAKTPPTWANFMILFNQNAKFKLYIPDGMSDVYKSTSGTEWHNAFMQKKFKEAYVVDDQPGENGTIMLDKDCFPVDNFAEGQTVTVSVIPAEGYQLQADSLLVTYKDENGEEMTADLTQDENDGAKYTFTMLCSNVTVTAEFEKIADESGTTLTASTLSEGNIWIIAIIAVVVIAGVATLVIVKKKTKPALADGTDSTDEE